MMTSSDASSTLIRLNDYQAPAWRVSQVELVFDLGIDATEVTSRLHLVRDRAHSGPLRLDGEGLELLSIALDGQPRDGRRR